MPIADAAAAFSFARHCRHAADACHATAIARHFDI
jgi:hypothetical protein